MLLPLEDKYIGLGLAISSSLAIGTSFIITKKGLMDASNKHGFEGNGYEYLKNPIWWGGMITMVIGEIANFAAYTFAPPILVTPLGALSVLIGAVLAAIFLKEELGVLGKMGCGICLIGSIIIVLHAPPDKEINTVDEILMYALQPGFLLYCTIVTIFAMVMIYKIAPRYGNKNPLVYISICSTVGSVSVMAIKGFGIAVKLTVGGSNQFTHPSTYVFAIVVLVCILTQLNYFNKALDQFETSLVNPIYYVTFTTCTLVASAILFKGFNTTSAVNTLSLLCGFIIIFGGVYLLNISQSESSPHSTKNLHRAMTEIPMENGIASIQARRSIQIGRDSFGVHRRSNSLRQEARLIGDYEEQGLGLTRLDEDLAGGSDEDETEFDTYTNTIKNSGSIKSRISSESFENPYRAHYDTPRGSKHTF
ncbi:magnesium transporter NIPA-domain-containing protein [Lipomyces japonicus]|uniref:magnesium transporter NIPA-domain-containing protein n=1 Tax=Lipomyces japonicus TaxID=56871 RepID=UPI0034CD2E83